MKGRSLGFLAATVAFAVFGGLHLEIAAGRSLENISPNDARLKTGTSLADGINRPAKGDREEVSLSGAEGRTITFHHPDLPSTTVAVRLWEAVGVAKGRTTPKGEKGVAKPKHAVACEGVVSALTEVAKQLEAGRCVT